MTVVAVGHTKEKFENLLKMIPEEFSVKKVFNGKETIKGAIHCPNDPHGRDVAMYAFIVEAFPEIDRFVFLNDDVKGLSKSFWDTAYRFLKAKHPFDIIGVPNLSSWVDHARLQGPQKCLAEQQGKTVRFIRTSAFMCTRDHFLKVWKASNGLAQSFEKGTLHGATNSVLLNAADAFDSNIEPYL